MVDDTAFNEDFAKWYRTLEFGADSQTFERRRTGVAALVKQTTQADVEALVRIAFKAKQGPSNVALSRVRQPLKDADNVFAMQGREAKGMDRKRILEAAIGLMPWSFETSFIWTTNPGALTKLLVERDSPLADAEFARFAKVLKKVCLEHAPNLFPRFIAEAKNG